MIKNIYNNQDELLQAIIDLYIPDKKFDADPMFGNGSFYKSGKILYPSYVCDLTPRTPDVPKEDARTVKLPIEPFSVILDPPFIHAAGKNSIMGNRFGSYPSQKALQEMYLGVLENLVPQVKCGGIIVFKNQAIVESGKQVWTHVKILLNAQGIGLFAEDLFTLVAHNRLPGWNHGVQKHARKFTSYFWVFRKPTSWKKLKSIFWK